MLVEHNNFQYRTEVLITVEISGMDIIVRGGPFKIKNTNYVLPDDFTFTCSTRTSPTYLDAYLVRSRIDSQVAVLVDEQLSGEDPYKFTDEGSYEKLRRLFWAFIPENTASLDGVEVHLKRTREGVV